MQIVSEKLTKMQTHICTYKSSFALCVQDWQVGGEVRAMVLDEDFVNIGCRKVFLRLQKNTDDSTSKINMMSFK